MGVAGTCTVMGNTTGALIQLPMRDQPLLQVGHGYACA